MGIEEDLKNGLKAALEWRPRPPVQIVSPRTYAMTKADPDWAEALRGLGPGYWPHYMVAAVAASVRRRRERTEREA